MSLVRSFDSLLEGNNCRPSAIDVVLHPKKPLILLAVDGTATTVGLTMEDLDALVVALMEKRSQLWQRVTQG